VDQEDGQVESDLLLGSMENKGILGILTKDVAEFSRHGSMATSELEVLFNRQFIIANRH
jgi:hypothetical protein